MVTNAEIRAGLDAFRTEVGSPTFVARIREQVQKLEEEEEVQTSNPLDMVAAIVAATILNEHNNMQWESRWGLN